MKISTVACLALAMVALVAPHAHSEEPEQLDRPEAISVPVTPVANTDREKATVPQTDNTTIHLDANNRLVGLSN